MKEIEYVLEFAMTLGSHMLAAGANLERANDTMNRVCVSYGLTDVSIFSLNSIIQISARSEEDDYTMKQISVPSMDIHLEKLSRLNQLSRRVCTEKPSPLILQDLLTETEKIEEYPRRVIIVGRLAAMGAMCVLFGGGLSDIIASDLIIFVLYWIIEAFSYSSMNSIISNMLCMFFAGTAAHFLVWAGIGTHFSVICITCSMMLVPGIPLVNAARNLLCNNEMNGILEALKAFTQTIAIVLGLGVSIFVFGGTL